MSSAHSTARSLTVYFIQAGDEGPVKVGQTYGDPAKRLKMLQTGCPFRLRLIATIPDAPPRLESLIHRRFDHLGSQGEWFAPAPELMRFIADPGPLVWVASIESAKRRQPNRRSDRLPGRPRVADDPKERAKHIRCAHLRLVEGRSLAAVCKRFRISARTVQLWCRVALTYADKAAADLRRAIDRKRQRSR